MKTPLFIPIVLFPLLALTGCNNRLFFATETRAGLNVAGSVTSPTSISLDYHRGEVAYVPKNNQGTTYSVYGGSDLDFSLGSSFALAQTFATGEAAIIAANVESTHPQNENKPARTATKEPDGDPIYFGTGTTFGLNIRAGDGSTQTPGMIVGYQRAEAVVIPTDPDEPETKSVYADISIVRSPETGTTGVEDAKKPRSNGGLRIRQSFGTGKAAVALAGTPQVQEKLKKAAQIDTKAVTGATDDWSQRMDYGKQLSQITDATKQKEILDAAQTVVTGSDAPTTYQDLTQRTI